jgi:hypothetical protein
MARAKLHALVTGRDLVLGRDASHERAPSPTDLQEAR